MSEQKDSTVYQRGYASGRRKLGDVIVQKAKLENALRQIADMDPDGQRSDDLGRAASVARNAIADACQK